MIGWRRRGRHYAQAFTVGFHGDRAYLVGSEDADTTALEALDDEGVRVVEDVSPAGGDHGNLGLDAVEESFRGRGAAAVVRDFQHIRADVAVKAAEGGFGGLFDVAGQQQGSCAVTHAEDDASVIVLIARPGHRRSRIQNFGDTTVAEINPLAGRQLIHRYAQVLGDLRHARDFRLTRFAGRHESSADWDPTKERGRAADMVIIGVREDERIEAPDSLAPQKGKDYLPAGVPVLEGPARVYHDVRAARTLKDGRVALTYIQESYL